MKDSANFSKLDMIQTDIFMKYIYLEFHKKLLY